MSLAIKYEGAEDAKLRLRNTVVLYKGQPVLIKDVRNGEGKDDILRVLFQTLPTNGREAIDDPFAAPRPRGAKLFNPAKVVEEAEQRKYISSKHFDIAPFKLGYVNSPLLGAFYCQRLPHRIQKQGLCQENFMAKDNFGRSITWQTFLTCKETVEMVAGHYPSFDQAMASLGKVISIAFHRDFCLVKDEVVPELVYLYYKGEKVGFFSKTEITLGKKFSCLKEGLEEMKVKVGVC